MWVLYGRHYTARYKAIAELIPNNARVLDLCCGPAILYTRYLRNRDINYTGLDLNARFIARLRQAGGQGQLADLRSDKPLPAADYVVMQASLYHFLPDPRPLVDRMLAAASEQVIITEPIRNMATSNNKMVAAIGRRFTNPGSGEQHSRFTEDTLQTFFESYADRIGHAELIAGGREKLYALKS